MTRDIAETTGTTIEERWVVDHTIARGPMSLVLGVWDRVLRREVALKLGLPTSKARTRMRRESRLLAGLQSPFVVRSFESSSLSDGTPYLLMERLRGHDLHARLRLYGAFSVLDTAAALLSILDALEELHAMGVMHRDIKASNVFRCDDGVYKLLDFGSAKGAQDPSITGQNVIGTLAYLSPEQIMGRSSDRRGDLWAVGVLGFRLLTGALPFGGKDLLETAHKIVNEAPPALGDLLPHAPPPFVWAIERCLSKSPEGRWLTAAELADALRVATRGMQRAG